MSLVHRDTTCEVLVIGGGPSGLTAAATLAPRVDGRVVVLDREPSAGGIPRHSDHPGYGIRDLHRFMSGPAYARQLVDLATRAGAEIRTQAMATDWADDRTVHVTSPQGRYQIAARAVILATGARERPRSARLIPGDRPAGVYTTGELQNLVHLHGGASGTCAVIVGAELVSFSAAMTLRRAGCSVALMTSVHPRPEVYGAVAAGGRLALGLRVATRTRVTQVLGRGRVQAVELERTDTRRRTTVRCDTVVFTGDWIPDHELVRLGGIELDPGTRGPLVDPRQATSTPGVFAIGNLVHPVATADVAALDGRSVGSHVLAHLIAGPTPTPPSCSRSAAGSTRIVAGDGLAWVTPGLLGHPRPPRGLFLAWPRQRLMFPTVRIVQDGRTVATRRLPWTASPGRVLRIPASIFDHAAGDGTELTVSID